MGLFIHNERLIFSILITISIALAGSACSLVLTSGSSVGVKRTFLYLTLLVLVHECSSLLVLYAPSHEMFRRFALIKSAFAYLLKSALLLLTGFYTGKRRLKALSLGIHLLSVVQVLLLLHVRKLANAVISFHAPFEARYGDLAALYLIVPGMVCIVMSAAMVIFCKLMSRKSRADTVFAVLLLLSITLLSAFYLSERDPVRDGMHVFLLIGGIAVNLKALPVTSGDDKYLSPLNILDRFSEAVIIHDRKGRTVLAHDGLKAIRLSEKLGDIHARLVEAGALNDSGTLSEGRITIEDGRSVHLQYKVSDLRAGKRVFGRIITLRDVSELVELQKELAGKNRQLELAFERKQRVTRAIRHLAVEKERARILDKVNSTANAYIGRIRREVAWLEAEAASGQDFHHKVRVMNDQLLEYTRSVIEEIRATVKKLNLETAAGESPGDVG